MNADDSTWEIICKKEPTKSRCFGKKNYENPSVDKILQTYPCPLRVMGITIHQVDYVVGDSRRCIPCRQQPICNISSLVKEEFVFWQIICAKKSTYNSRFNKTDTVELVRSGRWLEVDKKLHRCNGAYWKDTGHIQKWENK